MQPSRSSRDLEDPEGINPHIILQELDEMEKKMVSMILREDWKSVLELLRQTQNSPSCILLKPPSGVVTLFKDTYVHAAALAGQTEVVREMLLQIKKMNFEVSLGVLLVDDFGNTPLHIAALGMHVETFRAIVKEAPEMLSARNINGETPIFLASRRGSREFFSEVTSQLPLDITTMLRRNDGETILHHALYGEFFELACEIIERSSKLVYYRNGKGLTPLHILANNPSAFKSGSELGLLDRLLYSCIENNQQRYPTLLEAFIVSLDRFKAKWSNRASQDQSLHPQGTQSNDTQTPEQRVSAKERFFRFLKGVWVVILFIRDLAMLVTLALFGSFKCLATMKNLKWKHRWANVVMQKILMNIKQWRDFSEINSGMDPYRYQVEWTRTTKPGTELQGDKTLTALLQENEIPSAFETNFIQENQQITSTVVSPTRDSSSSSMPRISSYMHSSTKGASLDRLKEEPKRGVIESPFLIAGMKGVEEMVDAILNSFPEAIHDKDLEHKNIMLLAAEHRQFKPCIPLLFIYPQTLDEVDAEGNSILHLAAKYPHTQGLLMSGAIPGAALQMQQEIAWFNFFKKGFAPHFSWLQNHRGQTAMEVFTETHQELAMQRAKWLSKASQSCSVVATLIISVVFATISTVPGGLKQDKGPPVYRGKLAFSVFSVSSLVALCSSSISLVMFLGILTSPYQGFDVGNALPWKLIYGLGSLFISIAAMFISFFSGDLFVLDSKLKYIAYPIFVLTSCVALSGFPLYSEIVMLMVTGIPTPHPRKRSL